MNVDFVRWLYTSFEGRVRRMHYWLGAIALSLAAWLFGAVLALIAGVGVAQIVANLVGFALIVPLMTKRLHDRNKSWHWLLLFLGVPLLANLAQALGIGFERVDAVLSPGESLGPSGAESGPFGTLFVVPNALGIVISLAALGALLWALVELGFLRGTVGPNRFGPDPKGETA